MLIKTKKDKIIKKYRTHEGDTGSPQVQIALLTFEVEALTKHLKAHRKDVSSRRGLIKMVSDRRKLMKYLQRENTAAYEAIVKELELKG